MAKLGNFLNYTQDFIAFDRLNRVQLLLLGTLGALLLGVVKPWYALPDETVEAFSASLWLPAVMRLVPLLAFLGVAHMLWTGRSTDAQRLSLWGALGVVLLFPLLMAWFAPTACFLASAFDLQRTSVANHIETNFSDIHAQWKQAIEIDPYHETRLYAPELIGREVPNPLETLPVARPFQIDSSQFFQVSSWDWLMREGMNYTRGFMGSVGKGWPLTVAALVTALLAVYLRSPESFYSDTSKLAPWLLWGSAAILMVVCVPSLVDRKLTFLQAQGRHGRAATLSKMTYTCSPPLWGDTTFVTRMIDSCYRANKTSPVPLRFAQGMECWETNRLGEARPYFEKALLEAPDNFLIRGFLSATLLRLGADSFDRGQSAAAEVYFEEILQHFPGHMQATYYLMVSKAVNSDFKGSAKIAKKLRELDKSFQLPGIAAIGQTHLHDAWAVYRDGEMDQAWQSYRKSVDRGAW